MSDRRVVLPRLGVAVLASIVVLAACGGDDRTGVEAGAPLPLSGMDSAGGQRAMAAEDSAAMPMLSWTPIEFVAGDGLASLGDDQPAFVLARNDDQLVTLAERLDAELVDYSDPGVRDGRDTDPAHRPMDDGDTPVSSEDDPPDPEPTLSTGDGVSWYFDSPTSRLGVAVATCDPDGSCADNSHEVPATTTEAEAEAAVRALLHGIGVGLDGATVTVEGGWGTWTVAVEYRVEGQDVTGLSAWVSVGENAEIVSASGVAGTLEPLGGYPTLDTAGAIDRMNDGWYMLADDGMTPGPVWAMTEPAFVEEESTAIIEDRIEAEAIPDVAVEVHPVAPDAAAPPPPDPEAESGVAPGAEPDPSEPVVEPMPMPMPESVDPPQPEIVTLTEVEWTLAVFHAWDGSGIYIVPAYLFTGDDGNRYSAVAVTDDVIAPPDTLDVSVDSAPAPGTGSSSGGGVSGSSGATDGREPAGDIEPGELIEPQPADGE